MTLKLERKAFLHAAKAHSGQKRAYSEDMPYIVHPTEVAMLLTSSGYSSHVVAAGFLHDVLEMTSTSREYIQSEFGDHVLSIIESVTRPGPSTGSYEKREKLYLRKIRSIKQVDTLALFCADKICNMQSLMDSYSRYGDDIWTFFKAGPAKTLLKYESYYAAAYYVRQNTIVAHFRVTLENLRDLLNRPTVKVVELNHTLFQLIYDECTLHCSIARPTSEYPKGITMVDDHEFATRIHDETGMHVQGHINAYLLSKA